MKGAPSSGTVPTCPSVCDCPWRPFCPSGRLTYRLADCHFQPGRYEPSTDALQEARLGAVDVGCCASALAGG